MKRQLGPVITKSKVEKENRIQTEKEEAPWTTAEAATGRTAGPRRAPSRFASAHTGRVSKVVESRALLTTDHRLRKMYVGRGTLDGAEPQIPIQDFTIMTRKAMTGIKFW